MSIALITGPANAGKARAVLERFRAHLAREQEPILVVPTDADQARYRRELVEGGVTVGARVERFEGLLAEVVRRAGRGEMALGAFARERALARIAGDALGEGRLDEGRQGEGRLGEGRAASAGFARALAELVAELEVARVTPSRLRQAVELWADRPHFATSLCEIYEAYRERLARARRSDRELRATRSLDELRRAPSLWGQTPVLLYGFDSFTELELDAIETLGAVVDAPVTVSLAYEPGRVVFAGRAEAFQRLRPAAETHTELAPQGAHYETGSREALHHLERFLLEPAPIRCEPGEAVRLLEGASPRAEIELVAGEIRALLDEGAKPEEIAIVHRAPETVAGLLGEVLDDFEIPHSVRTAVRVGDTAIGGALLGLMRCAGPDGQLGDLLAWLRAPGVLDRPSLADALEARALRGGVTGADAARRLWEADHWPLDRIDRLRAAAAERPDRLVGLLLEELERLFCAPRRRMAAVLAEQELQEARALTATRRALEELEDLACWAPDLVPALSELAELLAPLALTHGERSPAGRIAVSDPLSLRARRVRALFLCGLQEGVFPAWAPPLPLLSDEERRALAQASGLVLPRERDPLAAERYLLYALCSRPQERLTLSWHTASEDGAPVAPSLFLDDVRDLFGAELRDRCRRRSAATVAWPGPGKPAGAMAARAAAFDAPSPEGEPAIAPLREGPVLAELQGRELWSASSLETWAACPVRWLVEHLLHLKGLDGDSELLARGQLAHTVLRETLERLREQTGSARLTQASLGEAKRLLRESLERHSAEHLASLAPERSPAIARRLRADLERYLEHGAESESPLEPTHFELEFGSPEDDEGLPALELAEGVSVRGRIDRVDVGPGGEAIIYDYKGRTVVPGAKWASDGALQIALYMAAVERLLGAVPVGGFYQPLAGRDLRARGLLDADAGLSLDCVRTDRRSHEELGETLQECRQVALTAASQARAGALEPRPRTCGYGGGCMYPEICRC